VQKHLRIYLMCGYGMLQMFALLLGAHEVIVEGK